VFFAEDDNETGPGPTTQKNENIERKEKLVSALKKLMKDHRTALREKTKHRKRATPRLEIMASSAGGVGPHKDTPERREVEQSAIQVKKKVMGESTERLGLLRDHVRRERGACQEEKIRSDRRKKKDSYFNHKKKLAQRKEGEARHWGKKAKKNKRSARKKNNNARFCNNLRSRKRVKREDIWKTNQRMGRLSPPPERRTV